jgi:hypothetical protein
MSWRITLDHTRQGADFNVPADGSMDEAVKEYGFQRPLKLFFKDRAALSAWIEACVRVYPDGDGETYWEINGPSALFQLRADGKGYEDVTGEDALTLEDYR